MMKMKQFVFSLFTLMAVVGLAGCGTDITVTDDVNDVNDLNDVVTDDVAVDDIATDNEDNGESTIKDGFELYSNSDIGFSIQYPNSWEYKENSFGSHVMLFTPQAEDDTFRENVGVITEILPEDMTVDEYYDAAKEHLADFISNYDEILNKNFKLGEFKAKKVQYLGTQGSYNLKRQQVFFIENKTAYVVTYTATEETFDDYISDVEAITETMTLD